MSEKQDDIQVGVNLQHNKREMGKEFYPHSLANVCKKVTETWHKEIIITENGVSSSDDTLREKHVEVVMDDLKVVLED